jgi:adenylosuccinate lyase
MTSPHDTWSSPLADRYASRAMLSLWSPNRRYGLWRRLWLALAEGEKALGVAIPDSAIAEMKAHLDDIDYTAVARYEKDFRHDVMAHIHAFGDVAPTARPFMHLGATSAYVTDNADLILMREGLAILREKLLAVLTALAAFSKRWRAEPTLGYTHLQPAQLTTVGKRATLWMQDLVLDLQDLEARQAALPLRGVKGTTGTQATFLELFKGDHTKVRALELHVCEAMGFNRALAVTGQTYTRKLDAQVLGVVAGIAASAAKFASDVRMLQSFGEISEPFESSQIGSSAMAYKRNPMRSERISSLARYVASLEPNANQTHAVQYFERTLDDSANRRLVIPDAFLATDAILLLMENIARGLEVHGARIRHRVMDELPFMATEELMVRAVEAGADRQAIHEVIRRHSVEAAASMKNNGDANDLLERLARDQGFPKQVDLTAAANPVRYIGRSPEQVDEFLAEVIDPILSGAGAIKSTAEAIRV